MKKKGASQVLWIVITLVMALVVLGVFTTIPTRMWEGIKIMGGLQTSGSISLCAAGNGVNSFFNTAVPDDIDNDGVPDNCDNCICVSPPNTKCEGSNPCDNKLSDSDRDGYPKACDNDENRGEDKFGKWNVVCQKQVTDQINKGTREFCTVQLDASCKVITASTGATQPTTGTNTRNPLLESTDRIKPLSNYVTENPSSEDITKSIKYSDAESEYTVINQEYNKLIVLRNEFINNPNPNNIMIILGQIKKIKQNIAPAKTQTSNIQYFPEISSRLDLIEKMTNGIGEELLQCSIFMKNSNIAKIDKSKFDNLGTPEELCGKSIDYISEIDTFNLCFYDNGNCIIAKINN